MEGLIQECDQVDDSDHPFEKLDESLHDIPNEKLDESLHDPLEESSLNPENETRTLTLTSEGPYCSDNQHDDANKENINGGDDRSDDAEGNDETRHLTKGSDHSDKQDNEDSKDSIEGQESGDDDDDDDDVDNYYNDFNDDDHNDNNDDDGHNNGCRRYNDFYDQPQIYNTIERNYSCFPLSFVDKTDIEIGNKIIMPAEALMFLMETQISMPMQFEIQNQSTRRVSHCEVFDFTGVEKGVVYLLDWMMENIQL